MTKAQFARLMTQSAINSACYTPEFKIAIKNIEQFIAEECHNGRFYVRKTFRAMLGNLEVPSTLIREAVAAYVREHGYTYTEDSTMAPDGNNNMWFQIAW